MNKNTWIIAIIIVAGLALLWFANSNRDVRQDSNNPGAMQTQDLSPTASGSPAVTGSPRPSPTATNSPKLTNKLPPASCQLTGSIDFLEKGLYQNKNANIVYKNIDSVARGIIWTVTPQDDLSVGPNLFATLPVPNGTEDVTVGLPDNPKSKSYTLTAKVTYGWYTNGDFGIKEAPCSGKIPVNLKF